MFSVGGMLSAPSRQMGFHYRVAFLDLREFGSQRNHGVKPFVGKLGYVPGRDDWRSVCLVSVLGQHDRFEYRVI